MSGLLSHALALTAQRIPVFFCKSDKSPTTLHGFRDATSDPEAVAAMYRQCPGPLVGVPTGSVSGFDALDLDLKHQPAGDWWHEYRGRMPATRVHQTRSGGLHLFFQHAAGLRNSASKITRGVDTRGDGGYVIWWPAVGFPILADKTPALWPPELLGLLVARKAARRSSIGHAGHVPTAHALSRLANFVATAPEGERNSRAFWAACRGGEMARSGMISRETVVAIFSEAAIRAGLDRDQAERTAWSGVKVGEV